MYGNYYSTSKKAKKKVFISFDFDNDKFLRDALVGQSKNEDSPFEIEDWSVKEPWDSDEWKNEVRKKLRRCDVVIVMVGEETYKCSGVKTEIKIANEEKLKVYGIQGYENKKCPRPDGLDGYYKWTWDNLKRLLS